MKLCFGLSYSCHHYIFKIWMGFHLSFSQFVWLKEWVSLFETPNLYPNFSQTPLSHLNSACESSFIQTYLPFIYLKLSPSFPNSTTTVFFHCSSRHGQVCCLCEAAASPFTVLQVLKQLNTLDDPIHIFHHRLSLLVWHRSWPSSSLFSWVFYNWLRCVCKNSNWKIFFCEGCNK